MATTTITSVSNSIWLRIKSIDWKKFVQGPAFVVLLVFGAFMLGRHTAPENTKVVTVDKITETRHELQTINQQVDLTKILQQIKDSSKTVDRTVIREIVTAKDGSSTVKETVTSHSDRNTKEQTGATETTKVVTAETKTKDDVKVEDKKTTTTTTTGSSDKWKVGVAAGFAWSSTSLPNHLVVGGQIERDFRVPLLGSLGVGAWVNSQAEGGLLILKGF